MRHDAMEKRRPWGTKSATMTFMTNRWPRVKTKKLLKRSRAAASKPESAGEGGVGLGRAAKDRLFLNCGDT